MDPSLLQLMESLVASLEQRDAGDPDAPPWEADRRIRQLEAELADRLEDVRAQLPERLRPAGFAPPMPRRTGFDLAGPAG